MTEQPRLERQQALRELLRMNVRYNLGMPIGTMSQCPYERIAPSLTPEEIFLTASQGLEIERNVRRFMRDCPLETLYGRYADKQIEMAVKDLDQSVLPYSGVWNVIYSLTS